MGDGDDDQQVEKRSEQGDAGQYDVNQHGLGVVMLLLPAGGVEEMWKAEFTPLKGLHHQRKGRCC